MHTTVNSFTFAYASSLRKQPTLSQHFTDVEEKKNAREIILHPVRSSRLLISRYCGEKCFDMLKQPKKRQTVERRRWEKKKEWKTEVKSSEHFTVQSHELFFACLVKIHHTLLTNIL